MSRTALIAACLVAAGACTTLTGCVIYLNPQCNDQIKNGEETGVDCGGGAGCGICDFGQGCRVNGDCDGSNCVSGICQPPPCENKVRDDLETDVDCGGGTCRKCSGGRHCEADSDCFSGTCVLAQKVCSQISVSFAGEVRSPSGFKAYAMFSGDLDGDGDPDIAVVNEYGSSISVFVNDYDHAGAFRHLENPTGIAPDDSVFAKNFPTGLYPTGGGLGDFDGDGHLDVVTANYHGNSISLLFNTGTGLLNARPTVNYTTLTCRGDPSKLEGCAETSNLAVGHLNNDGALDVVASNPQRASISLFLGHPGAGGRGDGTLDPAIDIPVGINGASNPYSVAIANFNPPKTGEDNKDKDTFDDVAIGDDLTGKVIVRLSNGDGTFQPEVEYEIRGTRDYILLATDINLDGNMDILCANRGSDSVSVLLGRGDGTFRKAIVTSVRAAMAPKTRNYAPYAIAVGDFNKDGVPDVITPNFMADSATILIGVGDGTFEPAIEVPFNGPTTPYGVTTGDFNHDGKVDFATANAGSNDLLVKLNNGQ
jgi:hypothetical protein